MSVYRVTEISEPADELGGGGEGSPDGGGRTLRDLRVAEVVQLDSPRRQGRIESYRAKLRVSFKYERE